MVINDGTGSGGSLNGLMGLKLFDAFQEQKTGKPTKVVDRIKLVESGNGAGEKR